MSKRASVLIVVITCTCIGLGIGYLVGAARSGIIITDYMLDLSAGLLTQRINQLALIRTGRPDDAAADMEESLDNSVVQLGWPGLNESETFPADRLPKSHLKALQIAKIYADAGYRSVFSEDSLRILDQVEPIDGKYCAAVLRELQEQASQ